MPKGLRLVLEKGSIYFLVILSELPTGTSIIDMGAANSTKYEPYIQEFIDQGKVCSYFPLDVSDNSLLRQVENAKDKFDDVETLGLWGDIKDGIDYGSIFYNAPLKICTDRAKDFAELLGPADRLFIGQDSPPPSSGDLTAISSPYTTPEYNAFIIKYLEAIQEIAGMKADPNEAWTVDHDAKTTMHCFQVVATQDLVCTNMDDYLIKEGRSNAGLEIDTLGKAEHSGMYQYLIRSVS
jgi:hypothetical protein